MMKATLGALIAVVLTTQAASAQQPTQIDTAAATITGTANRRSHILA